MAPKLVSVVGVFLVAVALLLSPTSSGEGAAPVNFTLTILHSNDAESQLISVPSNADFGGAARFKTLVDRLRAEASRRAEGHGASVLLSSGDNFIAGPQWNASLDRGPVFYDTLAMSLIGYDAAAIGNHEFDFGPEVLADFICGFLNTSALHGNQQCTGEAPFPFVTSNLAFGLEPRLQELVRAKAIVRSHVVEAGGERIGVVGATTPAIPFISTSRNVTIDPAVAAAVQTESMRSHATASTRSS